MTTRDAGMVEMLAFFKGGTASVLAGTDQNDEAESAGESIKIVTGTGASKGIIKETGGADSAVED